MTNPTSQALKGKKRPVGNQWRHGDHKDIMDNIYTNMDAAFNALEAAINAGWIMCVAAFDVDVPNLATADITPDGATTVVAGDRVLLPNQTNPEENGIYVYGTIGGTAPLTRATDLNELSEIQLGDSVWVGGDGVSLANTLWRVTQVPVALGGVPNVGNANDFIFTQAYSAVGALGITTALIDNLAVTTGKIALLAVDTGQLAALAVETAKIDNLAVTAGKIGLNEVGPLQRTILAPVVNYADTAPTPMTATEMVGGFMTGDPSAARAYTTATAVDIIAEIPGMTVGSYFDFTIVNLALAGPDTITVVAGAGVTLVGNVLTFIIDGAAPFGLNATFRAVMTGAGAVSIFQL
jgi:hypothetical protein